MEMEDHQYGMPDLRHLMNGSAHFPVIPQQTQLFSSHRSLTAAQQMEMMMIPPQLHEFGVDSATNTNTAAPTTSANNTINISTLGGLEAETGCLGGDGGTGRWPRQETLALLEVRSHLDNKFKEANQKGPLWDEVSRIMSEEHGYQRSGKKCREKFENLYKYYKKTKEGKAGKNYRFFRQLEALYGETSNPNSVPETHLAGDSLQFHSATKTFTQATQEAHQAHKHCDSLSLSNSSEFDTSSSDDNYLSAEGLTENDSTEKRRKRRGSKAKITDFIDSQMMKLMEKQEAWLEKMITTLDKKEQERLIREEEWRKQDAARIDREHKFWAKERAWIEARDAALMEAFQKLTGRELSTTTTSSPEEKMASEIQNHTENHENSRERDKCESINNYLRKDKKRKETRGSCFFENNGDDIYNQRGSYNCEEQETVRIGQSDVVSSSPSNSNARNGMPDGCFRFLMGDGENLWENYGLNLNKGENH